MVNGQYKHGEIDSMDLSHFLEVIDMDTKSVKADEQMSADDFFKRI